MKLATSGTLQGIREAVRTFYCMPDDFDPLVKFGENFIIVTQSGKTLDTWVTKKKGRFVFETTKE